MHSLSYKAEHRAAGPSKIAAFDSEARNTATEAVETLAPRIAKGAGITFLGDVFGKGINFISIAVLARLLGSEYFGLFALVMVVFNVGQTLSTMGLSFGVLRFAAIFSGQGDRRSAASVAWKSVVMTFGVGILVAVTIYLTSKPISGFLGHDSLETTIKFAALGIPFMAAMMVVISATRATQKMHHFVYVKNIFHPVSNLLLFLLCYWLGYRLNGAVFAWVLAAGLGLALGLFFLKREFGDFRISGNPVKTRELLAFSFPLFMASVIQLVFVRTDTIMLGYFLEASEVGVYHAASQLPMLVLMGLMAMTSIFFSDCGRLIFTTADR